MSGGDVSHYTAAHPQCLPQKNINGTLEVESAEKTWHLYFSPPVNENTENAILRLFKVAIEKPHQHHDVNCSEPEELIRIQVSYYAGKRNSRRKRLCSSLMISKYYRGWIELDVKSAVRYWKRPHSMQSRKHLKLAIDVQDQDEIYLYAETFFHSYSCEAGMCVVFCF